MSRYVTKKHGIVIGSDNWFFYHNEADELQEFKCILSVQRLFFDNYCTLHAGIRSPAEQLIFYPEVVEVKKFGWLRNCTFYRLKNYWVQWLNDNTPGWGYPPVVGEETDKVPSIFFMKRSHALAFYNHIDELLKGQRYI